ncbi:hypothetical protein [Winogradskyella luteola]|uniref:Lipocalin-like domain-containing protein n=1 Tax=Winogradskyella luteola TaxID=2828330 RepID=A0A9X1JSZ0_9FLAO|nr:hypothetical protein [Winogradskyella luteola]MBV7270127.1 hypothetical protein [Winogradskyella luteola]
MKSKFYILILILVTLSCNNDDDAQQNNDPTLNGSWSLVNVSGRLMGLDDDYDAGLITWTFNTETSQVIVSNLNVEFVVFDGLATGTYDYVLDSTNDIQTLTVENLTLDITTFENLQLILDEGIAADGFLLTFNK